MSVDLLVLFEPSFHRIESDSKVSLQFACFVKGEGSFDASLGRGRVDNLFVVLAIEIMVVIDVEGGHIELFGEEVGRPMRSIEPSVQNMNILLPNVVEYVLYLPVPLMRLFVRLSEDIVKQLTRAWRFWSQ